MKPPRRCRDSFSVGLALSLAMFWHSLRGANDYYASGPEVCAGSDLRLLSATLRVGQTHARARRAEDCAPYLRALKQQTG